MPKITVARMDGSVEAGFAPGALKAANVPIRVGFQGPPLGMAVLTPEGDTLVAEVDDATVERFRGMYPAIGGLSTCPQELPDGGLVLNHLEILELSFSEQPNADPSIGPIE